METSQKTLENSINLNNTCIKSFSSKLNAVPLVVLNLNNFNL